MIQITQDASRGLENDPRVAFVVTGGGNLKHWVNERYLVKLKRLEVHIYDRDDATTPKYETRAKA
jgi:putative ATP-dependent endonuclease of the OLD family